MLKQLFGPANNPVARLVDRHVQELINDGAPLHLVLGRHPETLQWIMDGCGHDLSNVKKKAFRRLAAHRLGQIITAQERHEPVLCHLERSAGQRREIS